jgi:DmsE family decaheme c-type cytochrome
MLLQASSGMTEEVEDDMCLACHEDFDLTIADSPHRLSSTTDDPRVLIACRTCHSGGEVHIADPYIGNIGKLSTQPGVEANRTCLSCHQPHMEAKTVGSDPHIGLELNCTSCHSIHKGFKGLLVDEQADFCAKCHVSSVNEFRKRSNHPLTDQNISCISCHDFTGTNEPDYGHGKNANCYTCHAEVSGPYLFEHEATSSFTTMGDGCTACHNPHGSSNERLLTQTGDRMCQQCHMEGPSHTETAHNGQYAGVACMECHSEVHGSYEPQNRFLLDPDLGAKLGGSQTSCYCHQRN